MANQANQANQTQDSWNEGLSQLRQAIEHNVTASRLLTTGAVALGAAATAYFWDPSRRTAFLETTRRLTDDMSNWWGGLSPGSAGGTKASTDTNAS